MTVEIEIVRNAQTITIERQGTQGLPGPNQVTTATATNINGLLKGAGGFVAQAVAGTDYSTYDSADFATDFAASDLANLGTRDYADLQNLPTLYTSADFNTDFAAKDTDDLAEGATNKYYASSLFNTDFAAADLADLGTKSYNDLDDLPTLYTSTTFNTDFAAKDTDDLAEGSTNLYSQFETFTDDGYTFVTSQTSSDGFFIGPQRNVTPLGTLAAAKFVNQIDQETNYFLNMANGAPSFFNAGAFFVGGRSRGTGDSPTAIGALDGLGGIAFVGYDGTGYSVFADSKALYGILVKGEVIATGNVRQHWDLGAGLGGNGIIRFNSNDQLGFYGTTPASRSTGWSAGTYTALKSFDPDTVTFGELARVVATLVDDFKTYGLLAA